MKSLLVSKLLVLTLFVFLIASVALAKETKKKQHKQEEHIKIQEQTEEEENRKHPEKRDLTCPNGCSGHGTCDTTTGNCQCDKHWSGTDCSYAVEELTSGVSTTGSVTLGRWQYYLVDLQASSNLNIWVNESSRWSDCDVYVQRNMFPSRSVYYASSTTSSSNSHIMINGALFGNWYIGVYGFSFTRCNFVIQVDVSSVCNSNCSGHGTCQNGECACDAGWTGADCSTIKTTLENGVATPTVSVAKWQWIYFLVNITSPSSYLKVTVQTLTGDPDVYVKRGKTPSTFSWDALNVTTYAVATVTIQTPAVDAYYVGVFGFQASTFTITAEYPSRTPSAGCPSQCSNHGICNGDGTCQCNTGYSGLKCQNGTNPLVIGTSVGGYVAQNDWNNYYFQYTTANPIQIHVEQSEANDDCDVYVKKSSPPTRFSFDAYSISAQQAFDVFIPNPSSFNWYIGVFGWKNCTYTMTLSLSSCDCVTGSHGSCTSSSGSKCACYAGYTGIDCLSPLTTLANGDETMNVVAVNSWIYYSFTITSSNVAISVKEMGTSGYFWVYVAENPPSASLAPTLDSYTYKETGTGSLHNIFITRPTVERITYVIGVYGSPYNPVGTALPFQIAVYGTNF